MWERDEESMDAALRGHDRLLHDTVAAHGGYVFSRAGDSFGVAFSTSLEAVSAAVEVQLALREVGLRVRIGLHVGEAHERDGDYFGPAL